MAISLIYSLLKLLAVNVIIIGSLCVGPSAYVLWSAIGLIQIYVSIGVGFALKYSPSRIITLSCQRFVQENSITKLLIKL